MKHDHPKLQQATLYLLTAALVGYGSYFLVRVTIEGGESVVNYGAAGPLLASAVGYIVAAFPSMWSEHRGATVALIAAGLASIALVATLCLVMGVFVLVAFVSPRLAILYPYTAVWVSAIYARWVSTSSKSQVAAISPLHWLVSSEASRSARVLLTLILVWSMVIAAVGH